MRKEQIRFWRKINKLFKKIKKLKKLVDNQVGLRYNRFCCEGHKTETKHSNVRVAQLDRASGYGPEGREFESSRAR